LCIEEYTKEHSDYVRKIEDDRKNEKISQLEKDNSQLKEDKNQLKEESERKDKIIAEKDRQLENAEKDLQRVLANLRSSGMSEEEIKNLFNN